MADVDDQRSVNTRKSIFALRLAPSTDNRSLPPLLTLPGEIVSYLPPDFGRGLKLNQTDAKLLKFYLVGYCQGRTLLSKTNFWIIDVAPMTVADQVCKACIAGTCWGKAVALITDAIAIQETHEIGKGDNVISAILLLLVGDNSFSWLLEGTEREIRKIHGSTGFCPKLLHTFAQVTHLSTRIIECPDSVAFPMVQPNLKSAYRTFTNGLNYLMVTDPPKTCWHLAILT